MTTTTSARETESVASDVTAAEAAAVSRAVLAAIRPSYGPGALR